MTKSLSFQESKKLVDCQLTITALPYLALMSYWLFQSFCPFYRHSGIYCVKLFLHIKIYNLYLYFKLIFLAVIFSIYTQNYDS